MKVNSNIYYNVELNDCERLTIAHCLKLLQNLLDTIDEHDCDEIISCDGITFSRNEVEDVYNDLFNIGMIEKMHEA